MRVILGVVLSLGLAPLAWAHPGELDACGGHTATEWVEYPPQANGALIVSSEPGEYHVHLTPVEMDEALVSLRRYRRQYRGVMPDDHGSFTVNGRAYDIWEYTRQGEAILHCKSDDHVLHTGIARMRVSE